MKVWAVVFGNYEPREVGSLWLNEADAKAECDAHPAGDWRVEEMGVEEGPHPERKSTGTDQDWRRDLAKEAEKALAHPVIQKTIHDAVRDIAITTAHAAAIRIRLFSIAARTAQVARAMALGIDPEKLKATREEFEAEVKRIASEKRDTVQSPTEALIVPPWKGDA